MKLRQSLVAGIFLALLILLGSYAVEWAAPTLLYYSPENLAFDQPQQVQLVWEFSRKMDTDSVENAIVITPAIDGDYVWEGNNLIFTPTENWEMGVVVTVEMREGITSNLSLPLPLPPTIQFEIRHILLTYLFEHHGQTDIYAMGADGDFPVKLTNNGAVTDFSVEKSGNNIFYSAKNKQFGTDIYIYDRFLRQSSLLFSCESALCENPAISPSGNHLAFTRTNDAGIAELWTHAIATSINSQVSKDKHEIRFLEWTTKGKLSFYDVTSQSFIVVGSDGGEEFRFSNLTGEEGSWSPDGLTFITPVLFTSESEIYLNPTGEAAFDEVTIEELSKVNILSSHLFAYTNGKKPINLSNEIWVEDLNPSISPNGKWVAFARRFNDEFRWIPGRQLAIMPTEGGQVITLTDNPQYKYSNFSWHPEENTLVAMRFNALLFTEMPEIWLFELTGKGTRLIIGGYNPQWIP